MLDKTKYKDCNNHIFTDINPEEKYKNKKTESTKPEQGPILKLQIILNMNELPEHINYNSIQQMTQFHTVYEKEFKFDRHSRIINMDY